MVKQSEENPSSPASSSTPHSSSSSTYEYDQESFDTFQHKISDLCFAIGLGRPSLVERLKGGSYNRVIGVTFDGQGLPPCVVRTPRFTSDTSESEDIRNQIAIQRFVVDRFPAAAIQAYDLTANNLIKSEYIFQTRLAGTSLSSIYGGLSHNEKISIVEQITALIVKIENIKFPTAGRLVASSSTPIPPSSASCESISCDIEITGFSTGSDTSDPNRVVTEPAKDLKTLFDNQFHAWDTYDKKWTSNRGTCEYWEKLLEITQQMRAANLLDFDGENVLFHWDLEPRNILVSQESGTWTITGVLDWDGALSVPPVLGRKPPVWLWDFGDGPSDWDGDIDLLPPKELSEDECKLKEIFDTEIEAALPGYKDDAYDSGKWLRRLARFALHGFTDTQDIRRYEKFVEDWNAEMKARWDQAVGES